MPRFTVRTANLRALNSLTKYPSIPTYHALDPRNGGLLDEAVRFPGPVLGTEKVDGTNSRIISLPDGTYLLGSREELLYAKGDLIGNPALGIVNALRGVAEGLPGVDGDVIRVHYLELYGGKVTAASRHYTDNRTVGWRLFDVAVIDDYASILDWPLERISAWRDSVARPFLGEDDLSSVAAASGLDLTPRLFTLDPDQLPTDIAKMRGFLADHLPATRVALGAATPGTAEGIVLRTADRSTIAKARFADYDRTLKRRR